MLLDFQVANYRSYREPQRLSLVAAEGGASESLLSADGFDFRALPSVAIYGANASGKSNLLKAMWLLGDILRNGPSSLRVDNPRIGPFGFSLEAAREPTAFEVNFLAGDDESGAWVRFEYYLSILAGEVHEEWLNAYPAGGRCQRWFLREPSETSSAKVRFSGHLSGEHKQLLKVTHAQTPFLWVAGQFRHRELSLPWGWLISNFRDNFFRARGTTAARCHPRGNAPFRIWVASFLRHADLGIESIEVRERSGPPSERAFPNELDEPVPALDVWLYHRVGPDRLVSLHLSQESEGTRNLFELLAPLDFALREGRLLLADEAIASLHPLLTHRIVECFHDPAVNTKGAQLILVTHDVSLLRNDLFRRDQVWFTEKNPEGETRLYSLHEFKPGAESSIAKNYLAGRYGAIPVLDPIDLGTNHAATQGEGKDATRPEEATAGTAE